MAEKSRRAILITGGSSGIGLAAAEEFYRLGDRVAIIGRDAEKGTAAIRLIAAQRCGEGERDDFSPLAAGERQKKDSARELSAENLRFIAADVRNPADCARAVAEAADAFGGIDVLVNSAGIYFEGAADELDEENYAAVMDTNIKGMMFMTKYALPHLKKSRGNIVNISSDAGSRANFYCSLYSASKGAVNMFTRSLALEAAHYGVRANAVAPGDIMTPLTERQLAAAGDRAKAQREMAAVYPLGRIGTAAEVAALIAYLASDAAAFITGAVFPVDGGLGA